MTIISTEKSIAQQVEEVALAESILVSDDQMADEVNTANEILASDPEDRVTGVRKTAVATTLGLATVASVSGTLIEAGQASASVLPSVASVAQPHHEQAQHPTDSHTARDHRGEHVEEVNETLKPGEAPWDLAEQAHRAPGVSVVEETHDILRDNHRTEATARDIPANTELRVREEVSDQANHKAGEREGVYTVREGDTDTEIAQDHHEKVGTLERENHQDDPNLIMPGQKLLVHEGKVHTFEFKGVTFKKGELVSEFAAKHGMTYDAAYRKAFIAVNPGVDPDHVLAGHTYNLPTRLPVEGRHLRDHNSGEEPHHAAEKPTRPRRHGITPPVSHKPKQHHQEHVQPKTHESIHKQRKHLEHLKLDIEGYHGNTWTKPELHKIQHLLPFYMKAAEKYHIPWQMVAVLHMREHDLSVSNPDNDQGVYQDYSEGHAYPAGPISMHDFERQTMHAAALLAHDYAPRTNGTVPGELSFNKGNLKKIAATFYAYNGMAYGNQARAIGYHSAEDAFQGSPYVMNLASRAQDSSTNPDWGQIVYDNGGMAPANRIPGAWLFFKDLVNITPGAEHITNADLDDNSKVKTAPVITKPENSPGQGQEILTAPADFGEKMASWMEQQEADWPAGVTDDGNTNPIIKQYTNGILGQPWCAFTADKAMVAAGLDIPHDTDIVHLDGHTYYLRSVEETYDFTNNPDNQAFTDYSSTEIRAQGINFQRGDVLFVNWHGNDVSNIHAFSNENHIAIVVGVSSDGTPIAISGNMSDRVSRNTYSLSNITAIARPNSPPPAPVTSPQPPTVESSPTAPTSSPQPTDPTPEVPTQPQGHWPVYSQYGQ